MSTRKKKAEAVTVEQAVLFGNSNPDDSLFNQVKIFFVFHMLYIVAPFGCALTPLLIIVFSPEYWQKAIGVVMVALYALTFDGSHKKSGRPWPWFLNTPLVQMMVEWNPIRILRTAKLDSGKQYVFGCHPHGTLAYNRAAVGFSTDTLWNAAFPGIKFRVLTATAAFFVPVIRELWLWSYCVDASKPVAVRVMKEHGCSIFVYPGGEKEQLETEYKKHKLVLRERKGFVKLAMQQGADLVPVYAFGETSLYKHHQVGIGLRKWLQKRFGVAIPLVSGEFGMMPYRRPVTLVFGAPIAVELNANPSAEQLDAMHGRYMAALSELFETHKGDLGYGECQLEWL
jgi:hypothetical protein